MADAHALMLTGVLRYCSDCDGERIFVEPDEDAIDAWDNPARGEFACTACGSALFIDPAMFAPSGVEAPARSAEAPDNLAG
jgi:hypothetical protein